MSQVPLQVSVTVRIFSPGPGASQLGAALCLALSLARPVREAEGKHVTTYQHTLAEASSTGAVCPPGT